MYPGEGLVRQDERNEKLVQDEDVWSLWYSWYTP